MPTTQEIIQGNLIALGFDNPSATAIYNKIAQSIGVTIDNTIIEINNTTNTINSLITTKNYGKTGYYTSKALAFQYGDNLSIDPVTLMPYYATVDPTKQIVKQAAFEEIVTNLYLKIATVNDFTGELEALSTAEYNAFVAYFVNFEIPGLPLAIISANANVLNFNSVATYFATYDLPTVQTNMATALSSFKEAFPFNGEFYTTQLSEYIKENVPGIISFFVSNTSIDNTPFSGNINLTSGYFNYDPSIPASIIYSATQ